MKLVDVAALTDVGRVRERNEDAYLTLPEIGTIAVADGMGGLAHGGLASSTAVATLRDASDALGRLVEDVDTEATAESRRQVAQALEFLAHMAAKRIQQNVQGRPSGTTLVSAALAGHHLVLCHVGDSRAYLYRDGALEQLTEDHTVAAARVRAGAMTPEEHDASPLQHILYQALGTSGDPDPDLLDVPVAAGDVVLLCSDGLSGLISHARIAELLATHAELPKAAEALVAAANDAGGRDNITVVLARVHEGPEASARQAREGVIAASPVLGALTATERRMVELYLDEIALPKGAELSAADGLATVLTGAVCGPDAAERPVVGLLALCGTPDGVFQVADDATLCVLSTEAYAELEPRRPSIAARLMRAAMGEVGAQLAGGATLPL